MNYGDIGNPEKSESPSKGGSCPKLLPGPDVSGFLVCSAKLLGQDHCVVLVLLAIWTAPGILTFCQESRGGGV